VGRTYVFEWYSKSESYVTSKTGESQSWRLLTCQELLLCQFRAFCNTYHDTQESLERLQQSLAIIEEAYTKGNFSRYIKKALTKFECAHVRGK
jgi:hypothetical protein